MFIRRVVLTRSVHLYSLLVFLYRCQDDEINQSSQLAEKLKEQMLDHEEVGLFLLLLHTFIVKCTIGFTTLLKRLSYFNNILNVHS